MNNEERNYKVYRHTNLINGKMYIGETNEPLVTRCGHNGWGYHYQPKFWNAICEFGWDNFKHEIIEDNLTHDEAMEKEKELIKKYNSMENGYNNSLGYKGCTGYHQTEEAKEKISKVQLGRERTETDREKVSQFFKTFYKTHPHPQKGRHPSKEIREKLSKSNSGEHSGNYKKYGYKNPTSKPVFQFDLNGNYIKDYGGAKDAARINNYKTASNICCCCNKYQNVTKAHGYIWRWQKDFTDQEKYDLIHNIKNLFDIENSRNM